MTVLLISWLKKSLKKIHHAIPARIRRIYMPAVERCLSFFQVHLNAVYPALTLYEGFEQKSRASLSFIYAGDIKKMNNYWDDLILEAGFQKRALGRRFVWKITREIKKKFPDGGFLIMESSSLTAPFLDKNPGFSIPSWVRMEIDISGPFSELFPRKQADLERRIRKNGLSFEITRDPERFDYFYYKMHMPYINMRYADCAVVTDHKLFVDTIPKSELLLIKKDEKAIAGITFDFKNRKPVLRRLGILDSNMDYVRFGAIGALYYFIVQELKKRGFDVLDIGGTRPFLSDGLTWYKLSMGAKLCEENSEHSCVRFMLLKDTPGTRSFLVNNPFLYRNKRKKICRALFIENNEELSAKSLDAFFASFSCPGTEETQLYVFGTSALPEDWNSSPHQPIKIQPAKSLLVN